MSVQSRMKRPAGSALFDWKTHVVQNDHGLSPTTIVVTDRVEDTIVVELRNELLNKENQKDAANHGQVKVVDQEERLELERLTVAHQFATTKDDDVVNDNEDRGRLQCRHGCLKRYEMEVLGRRSNDDLPSLAEYGPKVNAKGTIDRRQRELLKEARHCDGLDSVVPSVSISTERVGEWKNNGGRLSS